MSEFLDAYITCALWSSNDESDESGGQPMDSNYSESDIAPETLAEMTGDCERFCSENAALLESACERPGYNMARAGHDFWLTRNGHGAGFWDRSELESDSEEYEALTLELQGHCANWTDPHDKAASAKWGEIVGKRNALNAESLGEKLSEAARKFGSYDLYIGDDKQIWGM